MQTFTAIVAVLATITTAVSARPGADVSTWPNPGCRDGDEGDVIVAAGDSKCVNTNGLSFQNNNPKCIVMGFANTNCAGNSILSQGTLCETFTFKSMLVNCKNA